MKNILQKYISINKFTSDKVDAVEEMIANGCWSLETGFQYIKLSNKLFDKNKKLYWLSPLPPDESGVANLFSQQILPFIALFFEVIVVVLHGTWDKNFFSLKTCNFDDFLKNADEESWKIFNIGNNYYHTLINNSKKDKRSICIVHDAYIGHERAQEHEKSFEKLRSLAQQEGFNTANCANINDLIKNHPFIKNSIKNSRFVITHSKFTSFLIEKESNGEFLVGENLFSKQLHRQVRKLPNLKSFKNKTKIITCFGNVAEHKLALEVLHGFLQSQSFKDREAKLIFAGRMYVDSYCELMKKEVSSNNADDYVFFTDYIDEIKYKEIAEKTIIAIQLRRNTRGESSGAIVDCFSYLIPTISNSHGPFQELDRREVYLLSEIPSSTEVASAIDHLFNDSEVVAVMKNRMYRNNVLNDIVSYTKFIKEITSMEY